MVGPIIPRHSPLMEQLLGDSLKQLPPVSEHAEGIWLTSMNFKPM